MTETFIASAESDWLVIRNELASKQRAWAMIAYHAHQAAEKYLKVFLMRNGERPLRTPDNARMLYFRGYKYHVRARI